MAEIASVIASTLSLMGKNLVDQVFSSDPLYAWLSAGNRIQPAPNGLNIVEPIAIGKNGTIGWRDYRDPIDFAEADPFTNITLPWRFLNGSISWYKHQEDTCAGESQVFDLVSELKDNFISSMSDVLATSLFTDGSAKQLHGIPAFLDNDNTYGGIDRTAAANAIWQSNILATSEAFALRGGTDKGFSHLYRLCSGNGGQDPPDFGVTTEDIFSWIESKIEPSRIYENPKMIELGYPNHIQVNNAILVWNNNCPTGQLHLLNSKYLKLRPHTSCAKKFFMTKPEDLTVNGQFGRVILVEWKGNIVCKRPNRMGSMTNKTVTFS